MPKRRKGRRNEQDDEGDEGNQVAVDSKASTPSFKDLDFAQRRALQRQQAAEKRRSKQKCYLCGRPGHVRKECPGIADDGRGMSHFKGKSDKASEQQKLMQRRKKRGSSSGNYESAVAELIPIYPEEFTNSRQGNNGLHYFDVRCNVNKSIEYLRCGRGKAKISLLSAETEYRAALFMATGLQAIITESYLVKPGRPWTNPLPFDWFQNGDDDGDDDDGDEIRQNCDGSPRLFFVLGLSDAFPCIDESQQQEATQNLVSTIQAHTNEIIAVCATLNYTNEITHQPRNDSESQLQRLEATWHAAGKAKVPLQLHLLPGAASLDADRDSVAGTEYAKVLLDAQAQLARAINLYPELVVHIVGWSGKAVHMMSLLQAFPDNLQAIGLDGTVSFAKANDLHECAFEIPLEKFVLETSTTIPSQINNCMGRAAFFHSGWWPFVAQSFAHHKRNISVEQIVKAANENASRLYPCLCTSMSGEDVERSESEKVF